MLFKEAAFGERSDTSVAKICEVMNAINRFAEENKAFNSCRIEEMNDFSENDHGRIDIYLRFENIDEENKVIHNTLRQKVFFVDGEILDCLTYAHRCLEV